jgi:histidinol-phosphate aminotransferase
MLADGGDLILPVPTFEMIARYAALAGGRLIEVPWPDGPYPLDSILARSGEGTRMIAFVSPNNPTGAVATAADLRAISRAAPHALILVDHAYAEFADEDLTREALSLGNALVLRTFSKAWGLAGLRIGYAIGGAEWLAVIRACGNPFPVTGPSLLLARAWLRSGAAEVAAFVEEVRREREALGAVLREVGAAPLRSQANFVCSRGKGSGSAPSRVTRASVGCCASPAPETRGTSIGWPLP